MNTSNDLQNLMSMMAHQLRGYVDSVKFNAETTNVPALHIALALSMKRIVDIAGLLSYENDILMDKIVNDVGDDVTPAMVLGQSMVEVLRDLTSRNNTDRILPYYLAYAIRNSLVDPSTTLAAWSKTHECHQISTNLQETWHREAHELNTDIPGIITSWVMDRFLPIELVGYWEDATVYSRNGIKSTILNIVFTEFLKNAIKYSDPKIPTPITIGWHIRDNVVIISCGNGSTRATRMREKSKGSGGGFKFLSLIADKLGGVFETDIYMETHKVSTVKMTLPSNLF